MAMMTPEQIQGLVKQAAVETVAEQNRLNNDILGDLKNNMVTKDDLAETVKKVVVEEVDIEGGTLCNFKENH